MATVFLEEQSFTFSKMSNNNYYSFGKKTTELGIGFFELGKNYEIVFDGESFTGTPVDVVTNTSMGTASRFIGNLSIVGQGDDTGEPCVVRTVESTTYFSVQTLSTDSTHTLAIYEVEEEVTLSNIDVTYDGGDVPFGTSVSDLTGIMVTANYSDGTSVEVTDYTLSGDIVKGDNVITVSYEGLTATFTVTCYVELASLSASYTGGDVPYGTDINALAGLTVTAIYTDGSTEEVSGYTLSGEILEGENIVTVTYEGMTTTFSVTGYIGVLSISATYTGDRVVANTDISTLTGIEVIASYSDGSTKIVTDYTLSGEIGIGENIITVTYEDLTTTFVVIGYDGVYLRDRSGIEILYENVTAVQLKGADGGLRTFYNIESMEKTITPDFSSGDIEVLPDDGKMFSKVTVEKPSNLLPANIAKGVEIAGVVGEYTGGYEVEIILPATDITTAYSKYSDAYECTISGKALVVGKIYIVWWDGVAYVCKCQNFSGTISGTTTEMEKNNAVGSVANSPLVFGSEFDWNASDTGEPFLISYTSSKLYINTLEATGAHTIKIEKLVI